MDVALLIPEGDTLITYYLLPLIGLNRKSFGRSFKSSYIDRAGTRLFVELSTNMVAPTYRNNPNYIAEIALTKGLLVMFVVHSNMLKDVKLFLDGKYSEMSKATKKIIYKTSTLSYNKTMGSFKMSNPILQALDKTNTLRSYLEDTLGIVSLPDSAELIDKPKEHWFIENKI